MRKFLALPLALILTVVSTSGAFAHAELIKSFPAANSVQVKSPNNCINDAIDRFDLGNRNWNCAALPTSESRKGAC